MDRTSKRMRIEDTGMKWSPSEETKKNRFEPIVNIITPIVNQINDKYLVRVCNPQLATSFDSWVNGMHHY
jgi:hypothetical protein